MTTKSRMNPSDDWPAVCDAARRACGTDHEDEGASLGRGIRWGFSIFLVLWALIILGWLLVEMTGPWPGRAP